LRARSRDSGSTSRTSAEVSPSARASKLARTTAAGSADEFKPSGTSSNLSLWAPRHHTPARLSREVNHYSRHTTHARHVRCRRHSQPLGKSLRPPDIVGACWRGFGGRNPEHHVSRYRFPLHLPGRDECEDSAGNGLPIPRLTNEHYIGRHFIYTPQHDRLIRGYRWLR
jgi:hypothetical protein